DEVVVFGYDLGMNHSGGFSQYIRVPKNWVLKKPSSISFKEVMIYGTAGITAALCVDKLLKYGVDKNNGEILVTGATGGVGLFSIAILSKLGFDVVAVTGKTKEIEFLKDCGAKSVMSRTEVEDTTGKPLLKPRWNAAIDAVGGNILVSILKSLKYGGAVACCGLAQSPNIHMTVFPFILRGVSLLGVDSVELPIEKKDEILNKIATIYKIENLDNIYTEIGLEEIKNVVPKILKGEVVGRYLVKID
ncbi:MAG: YhdH/YhfP family quinone oxidoreductase, partial [Deferribacterales bacterium]